jgi:hypothetical protein
MKVMNARRVTINGKRVRVHPDAKPATLVVVQKRAPESTAEANHLLLLELHRQERKDEREVYTEDLPATARLRSGYVYVITNPAWPGCVKVGRAGDPDRRLAGYQTASPKRDYERPFMQFAKDCFALESLVHRELANRLEGEWFEVDVDTAVAAIRAAFAKVEGSTP